jgi:D-alanyl-lipoteichoic acid acyltransferase DltB (MBOAT superfamily)
LILAFTIAVDYVAGRLIEASQGRRRKLLLAASVAANLGVLFFFKYFNFANTNLAVLAGFLHWNYPLELLSYALPIGLSFHVFQSLSYTIEVYRGRQAAERHPGIFALYVMFFPQLVAGPIERPQNVLHQFHERQAWDAERVLEGLGRMLWGFFKKCVVADRIAYLIAPAFAAPASTPGPVLLLAVLGFAVQIYCDFSGYSDIALGSARVMGFRLMENFRRPYAASSIAEFWTRWHISLSSWFRDYVYIPLGGNRAHWARNVVVVFLLSGLWHGANWTFVAWGGLHAAYMLIERVLGSWRARLPHAMQVGLTFAAVAFAWIFFRAPTLGDAAAVVTHMFAGWGSVAWPDEPAEVALAGLASLAVFALEGVAVRPPVLPPWGTWLAYQALLFAVVFLGLFQHQAFIYFQF